MDGRDAGDLRHRTANFTSNEDERKLPKQQTFDGVDSDDDKPFGDDAIPDLSHRLPQASDKTTEILDQALSGLPSRFVYILFLLRISRTNGLLFLLLSLGLQMEKLHYPYTVYFCYDCVLHWPHILRSFSLDGSGAYL